MIFQGTFTDAGAWKQTLGPHEDYPDVLTGLDALEPPPGSPAVGEILFL